MSTACKDDEEPTFFGQRIVFLVVRTTPALRQAEGSGTDYIMFLVGSLWEQIKSLTLYDCFTLGRY